MFFIYCNFFAKCQSHGQYYERMHQNIDEAGLVRAVLHGERSAFERLVRQYEKLVLHIVTPLAGTGLDREDICQEVFIKVYTNLSKFHFKSKLSTWIGSIAYNHSLSYLSRKKGITMSELYGDD